MWNHKIRTVKKIAIHPLKTLFETAAIGQIDPAPGWTIERMDWGNPDHQNQARKVIPGGQYYLLNGHGTVSGHLIGGCIEVLEMLKGLPSGHL